MSRLCHANSATETDNVAGNAEIKLKTKNLDMIVANDVSQEDAGFNVDTNRAQLYFKEGEARECELMSKDQLSNVILDAIVARLSTR